MYANSSNSTTYNEINKLEVSNNTEIDNIKILENQENFVDEKKIILIFQIKQYIHKQYLISKI